MPAHRHSSFTKLNRVRCGRVVATCFIVLLAVSVAGACNIPVFRYALERWKADPCDVIVFHRGTLSELDQQLIASWTPKNGSKQANVQVRTSDLAEPSSDLTALWKSLPENEKNVLPYVVMRTKIGPGKVINGWHGSLNSIADRRLLQSPIRKELGRRLLTGHSVVWLLIRSSDKKRTEDARQLIQNNLEPLSRKIQLPEGIGLPGSELHSEIPLFLKFSLLEVDPNDPKEEVLIKLLTGFQPEAVAEGDPLLVPVFGRGRALEVIPASQMSERLMEDLTGFLSGACSCQVKEQNPGFDLLLSVDWNTELFGEGQEPPAERTTRDRQKKPILLTIPPGNEP